MTETSTRTWFETRMVAYAVGLLTEEDHSRMNELCAGNPAWKEELAMLMEERTERDPGSIGHVPDSLLARWEKARDSLPPMEWRLVAGHTRRCDECRKKLDRLGITIAPAPRSRFAHRAIRWSVAAAAILMIAIGFRVLLLPEPPEFQYTVLRAGDESMAQRVNTIYVDAGTERLNLVLPPVDELGWPGGSEVEVQVRGDSGMIGKFSGRLDDLVFPEKLELRADGQLATGEYEVLILDRGESETRLRFWIEHR